MLRKRQVQLQVTSTTFCGGGPRSWESFRDLGCACSSPRPSTVRRLRKRHRGSGALRAAGGGHAALPGPYPPRRGAEPHGALRCGTPPPSRRHRLPAPLARGCHVREASTAGRSARRGRQRPAPPAPHGGGSGPQAGEAAAGPSRPGHVPAIGRARRRPGPGVRRPLPPGAAAAPPRPYHLRSAAAAGSAASLRASSAGNVVRPLLPLRPPAGPPLRRWAPRRARPRPLAGNGRRARAAASSGERRVCGRWEIPGLIKLRVLWLGGLGRVSPSPCQWRWKGVPQLARIGAWLPQVKHWDTRAAAREPWVLPFALHGWGNGVSWDDGMAQGDGVAWGDGTAWMQCGPGESAPSTPHRKVIRVTGGRRQCLWALTPGKNHAVFSLVLQVGGGGCVSGCHTSHVHTTYVSFHSLGSDAYLA